MTGRWRPVGLGLLSGLGWGVAARAWMRSIATDPAFTWSGTLYILGAAALAGLMAGCVGAVRRPWAKVFGVLALVPLGMGAGALMLPTILLGTIALRRRTLPGWARALAAILAVVPLGPVVADAAGDRRHPVGVVVAVAAYLALCAWMIRIAEVSLGTAAPRPLAVAAATPSGAAR